jgi:hypothetical protein
MLASRQLSLCSWSYHNPMSYATALTRHPFMPSSVLKVGISSQPSCLADWRVNETVIHHQTAWVSEWQYLQLYNSSTQFNFTFYFSKSSEMWYVPLGLSLCVHGASYSRVAPENVGLQKEEKYNTFAFIPVMKCGCVFWDFAKRKLATRKDKMR